MTVLGNRTPEVDVLLALGEGRLDRVEPRVDDDADRDVEGVGLRGERLVEPAPRQVERAPGAEGQVTDRLSALAEVG